MHLRNTNHQIAHSDPTLGITHGLQNTFLGQPIHSSPGLIPLQPMIHPAPTQLSPALVPVGKHGQDLLSQPLTLNFSQPQTFAQPQTYSLFSHHAPFYDGNLHQYSPPFHPNHPQNVNSAASNNNINQNASPQLQALNQGNRHPLYNSDYRSNNVLNMPAQNPVGAPSQQPFYVNTALGQLHSNPDFAYDAPIQTPQKMYNAPIQQPQAQSKRSSAEKNNVRYEQRTNNSQNRRQAKPRQNQSLASVIAKNRVFSMATDQNGSRFLQNQMENATESEKQGIFEQILPQCFRLCTDVFGNYVIQKFFEHGGEKHKHAIAEQVKHQILPLSLQMYGCRVVQKVLENVNGDTQTMLVKELAGNVLECVKDQNGNHVIQKCIEQVNCSNIDFIVKAFHGHVFELCTHPYGCRVIQRMLEHCNSKQKRELMEPIMNEMNKYITQLCEDQYGNYVIQHILQHSKAEEERKRIVKEVAQHMLNFSRHKFASNIVERCFIVGSTKDRDYLLQAFFKIADRKQLPKMVEDKFGNYVIQTIIKCVNKSQRRQLVAKIYEAVPNLQYISFGKHIKNKIDEFN